VRASAARGAWLALAAAVTLSACVLAPKFETPQLSVVGVQLQGGDLWSQRLKVRIRVDNPNDRELPVSSIVFTLEVEGQELASGESAASFVVPARGQAEFDTNVTANVAGALLRLLARNGGAPQSVDYHLSGKVALSGGLLRSIPFDDRGTVRLQ
jgi:LEA14-like dessication related protein